MAEIHGIPFVTQPHATMGECWVAQTAEANGRGHRNAGPGRSRLLAHRFVFEMTWGVDPGRGFVCHHCDVRACVRPEHLYLGDGSTNAQDREDRNPRPLTTRCHKGHERIGKCNKCRAEAQRRYTARHKAK